MAQNMNMYEPNRGYNPFSPASFGSGPDDQNLIPQISSPEPTQFGTPEPSTMDKIGDVALDKGGNVAADKGGDMLTNALAGGKGGGATATEALTGHVAKNAIGKYAASEGPTAASGGALAGMGAAMAPVLPFVIGAMALKSIFKK